MSKQIKQDPYQKRLRVAVRFDGTQFVLLDGSPLPRLAPNSLCEIVFRPEALQNPDDQMRLVSEQRACLLGSGSVVMLGVGPHLVGDPKARGLICNPQELGVRTEYWLVEVRLLGDLLLRIRGDQEAKLEPCTCLISALEREATSLNHAFTLISEAYETERLSHTGNVFERAYTPVGPTRWQTLDELRINAITQSLQKKLDFSAAKDSRK